LPKADWAIHWAIADRVIAAFLYCGIASLRQSVDVAIAQSAITQ
jgi:hypothetical protein